MEITEKILKSDTVFTGKVINVKTLSVRLPNGNEGYREIVEHNGGVCVAPLTDDNKLIFVHQFRCPYQEETLEIPAGKLEKGEDHREAWKRELKEETGCTAGSYEYMGIIYPTPGYCAEKLYLYFARNLTRSVQALDDDEFLNVEEIEIEKALEMVMNGEIKDSKTQIAVLKVARMLGI
ncbi:MAG: NUDIX hydrolase [Ruminococcaceae bacterium]|nr:NUDIX hydrolase [Oscillospiraceae bacterium]